MKKASALLSLVSIFLLFSGCSWEIPEKVSVKTNAIYNFSFGALEKSLDEELDFKTILATDNEDVKIYDYFPQKKDTKVQQFLITMKVFEKDLHEIVQDNAVFNAFLQNCPAGISINLDSLPAGIPPLTVSGSESFDFNPTTILSSVKESMGEEFSSIQFCTIPAYIYCYTGGELSADATLKMYYGDESKNSISPEYDCYIAGSAIGKQSLEQTLLPELIIEEDSLTVVSDLALEKSTVNMNIADFMNNAINVPQETSQACINYDISLKGELTKEQLMGSNAKIVVYAVLALPIQFKVTDDIFLDIRKFVQSDEAEEDNSDIFGRTEATGLADKQQYIDVIRSASLIYSTASLPFVAEPGIIFSIDMIGDNSYKDYVLEGGNITLNYDDIHKMIDTFPLRPNLQITIQKDSVFSVPRNRTFNMSLMINLITDGTIKLF